MQGKQKYGGGKSRGTLKHHSKGREKADAGGKSGDIWTVAVNQSQKKKGKRHPGKTKEECCRIADNEKKDSLREEILALEEPKKEK